MSLLILFREAGFLEFEDSLRKSILDIVVTKQRAEPIGSNRRN